MSAASHLARFVGLDAYESAGGTVQRDLFTENDHGIYLLDRPLLTKLAETELQKTADRLAKQWKWAQIHIEPDRDRIAALHRLRSIPGKPTAAERKHLEKIEAEIEATADTHPDDPAERGPLYARSST